MDLRFDESSTTISAALARQARLNAETIAYEGDQVALSFGDLHEIAKTVGPSLHAHVGAGGPVGYMGGPSPVYFAVAASAAHVGVPILALNSRLASDELARVISDSTVSLVFVEEALRPALQDAVERAGVDVAILPADLDTLGELGRDGSPPVDAGVVASTPLMLIYTSGTSGQPKGVVLSHENVLFSLRALLVAGEMVSPGRFLVQLPTFHVSGAIFGLAPLLVAGTAVTASDWVVSSLGRLLADQRIDYTILLPTLIRRLLADSPEAAPLAGLRSVIYGGEPMDRSTVTALQSRTTCRLLHSYGLTETGGTVTAVGVTSREALDHDVFASVGRPHPGVDVRIVDRDDATELPEGQLGEVEVRGPMVMQAYWGRPDVTAEALDDGWLRTGDLGEIRNGYLHLRDRLKDLIVSGGENIYAGEIEKVLGSHDAVMECAVIGAPDLRWGEVPVAYVVLTRPIPDHDLVEHCRRSLAGYKCPRTFIRLGALPRNSSHKVDKVALRGTSGTCAP